MEEEGEGEGGGGGEVVRWGVGGEGKEGGRKGGGKESHACASTHFFQLSNLPVRGELRHLQSLTLLLQLLVHLH